MLEIKKNLYAIIVLVVAEWMLVLYGEFYPSFNSIPAVFVLGWPIIFNTVDVLGKLKKMPDFWSE